MEPFNPLDHPIGLVYPARVSVSAWTEHVPFAMTLIDMLRPRVVVELGAYYGVSYCAFCQAIARLGLGTRAYAVDTWQGDAHAGFNGPEILEDLKAHHDPLYSGFSRLIAATFDEALAHFSQGSIDLLHIDGYHTYEAVKHDFENWLPKMSACGVMLFHDINVRQNDFGVWRFWEEVRRSYPAFEFTHHHGLGVLAVGAERPQRLQALLGASAEETARIREYFFQLGRRISQRWNAGERIKDLVTELAEQRQRLTAQIAGHQTALAEQRSHLAQQQDRLAEQRDRLTVIEAQLNERERQLAETDQARRNCLSQLEEKENHLLYCHASLAQQAQIVEQQQACLAEQLAALQASAAHNQNLEARVRQQDEEIFGIKSSLTWRSGQRLSMVVHKLAPPGTWRRQTLKLGRRAAGVFHRRGVLPVFGALHNLHPRPAPVAAAPTSSSPTARAA